jgi:myosin heavy subunit
MYSHIFEWVVSSINKELIPADMKQRRCSIGVLDIFGFESLRVNTFEQICINYTVGMWPQLSNYINYSLSIISI